MFHLTQQDTLLLESTTLDLYAEYSDDQIAEFHAYLSTFRERFKTVEDLIEYVDFVKGLYVLDHVEINPLNPLAPEELRKYQMVINIVKVESFNLYTPTFFNKCLVNQNNISVLAKISSYYGTEANKIEFDSFPEELSIRDLAKYNIMERESRKFDRMNRLLLKLRNKMNSRTMPLRKAKKIIKSKSKRLRRLIWYEKKKIL